MKIENRSGEREVHITDVTAGEVFRHEGVYYMATEHRAVNLETGELTRTRKDFMVVCPPAKLVIGDIV